MITPSYQDCWFLTGCTASGKTVVGLELAERLNAEILALDSMTVYRGMDIGTAKPSNADRRRVAHHLIDIVDPDKEFSLAAYLQAVEQAVTEVRSRGRCPLFVGGTPLYLKALLRGVFTGPPADWDFRRQIREEVAQVGVEALHERLRIVDPLAASKLPPNDVRRIIRALEVQRETGRPISHWQTHFDEGSQPEECRVFVLDRPREEIHRRIEARVEKMFHEGFLEEVETLQRRYGQLSRTAAQAVGYREVLEQLPAPIDLPATQDRIRTRSCQFAKRQTTWFRGLSECRWISCDDTKAPGAIADIIVAAGAGVRSPNHVS
jgi:tRNA dimethylallyltransferase